MAESYNPDTVWKPFGAFSQIIMAGGGQVVHLKGQVALDRQGNVVGVGDMAAQVDQVLGNIKDLLAEMNGRMSDIFALSQFTTDIKAFMTTGQIREQHFQAPFPVTTTVEVKSLYDPRLLIEITATAEIPRERFIVPKGSSTMHA